MARLKSLWTKNSRRNRYLSDRASRAYDLSRSHFIDALPAIVFVLLTVTQLCWAPDVLAAEKVTMDLRVVDGNFHIEFMGTEEWDYDLDRKELDGREYLELRVPSLASQEQLKNLPKNDVVESIFLQKVPGGSKDILTINLKLNAVESFDYLTEKPSRLVIDLYLTKKAQALASAKQEMKNIPQVNPSRLPAKIEMPSSTQLSGQKLESTAVSDQANEPASLDNPMAGIFDGGDPTFERFAIKDYDIKEAAIVKSRENLYLPFPMLIIEGEHFEQMKNQPPVYEIEAKNNAENKMARLVLTLFEKNRLGVCLKTANWFLEKYPNSEYEEIIRFMLGDIYFKMWQNTGNRVNYDTAMQAYREASLKYPNSILSIRTQFLMGYSAYSIKDYFTSLQTFQGLVNQTKPSELRDKAQVAVARSLMRLNQVDEAIKTFEQMEKEGFAESNRVEAQYLKGDIYYFKQQYAKATAAYLAAAKKYPKYLGNYPNAIFNLAESLFWQKQYKAALDSYRAFLSRFPNHPSVPYAMTRAGETLEILGAEPRRVMGAFLESYFRFGGTEGATVPRMRILSNRMKQMKEKEAERGIEEINKLAETSTLPGIDLFGKILIADGLSSRGDYLRSIDTLLKWYQNNPTTGDAKLIKRRVERHVNEKMEKDLSQGDFFSVMKLHNKFGELWLKGSSRIDTIFNLGRAFELAGAYKEADVLFRDTFNKLVSAKNSTQAIEHSVFERLPSTDQVLLRLAKVKAELAEGGKAYDYIREIKEPLKLSEEEQIERMEVAVNLLKARGEIDAAKTYLRDLVENWKGQPMRVVGPRMTLAELETNTKNYDKAEVLLKNNLSDLEDAKKIPSEEHLSTLKLLSDTLSQSNNSSENISQLNQMLELYSENPTLDSYRFRLGKIYFDQGNLQKANETWKVLEQKKSEFWWGLAQNYLKDNQWRDTYQKYIKRIPAMAKSKEDADVKGQN